jgi:hypothetical protein
MYAPFRLPPLDYSTPTVFDPYINILDGDVEEYAPVILVLKMEGIRQIWHGESLCAYTFKWNGHFGSGQSADSLEPHTNEIDGQILTIQDTTHTFNHPTFVKGNKAQTKGHKVFKEIFPVVSFEFLGALYALESLEFTGDDTFEAIYKIT